MNPQLMYPIAQQQGAELHRAGQRARLASEARAARRSLRRPNLITGLSARAGQGSPPGMTTLELDPTIASDR
jgi:hypothetical protein